MAQPAKTIQTMTIEQALNNFEGIPDIKSKPEFEIIKAAVNQNVVALGTDEAFALRDNEGEIRAFRQNIRLSLDNKTLTQPVPGGDIVISAQGYEVWAEGAGANVIFPDQVLVGASWQPNPYAIMDEHNGRIRLVYARAVAFRFSSKGIPQVCDWTTIFDTAAYRMIDLIGKAKKFPQAFRLLPKGMNPPEDEGTWGAYTFDEAMVLWVNSAHGEALQWYGQIINREKKSLDFAQTFARRNSLKHLSGLQKAPGQTWNLSVLCWRPTSGNIIKWDATQYIQLQKRVGGLIHSADKEFKTKQVDFVKTGHEDVADENGGVEVIATEMDPEDQDQAQAEQKTESAPAEDDLNVLENLNYIRSDPELRPHYLDACKQLGLNHGANHDVATARKILDELNK